MVVFVVLIDCQATLGEWTLMTSHSSGNGPLSRMGDYGRLGTLVFELAKKASLWQFRENYVS